MLAGIKLAPLASVRIDRTLKGNDMRRKFLAVFFLAATAMAVNACDRDDSTVGKGDPAGNTSPSAGSGGPSKAGEASEADPTKSVKESVFGDAQTQQGPDTQTQTAQGGTAGEPTDSGKAQESPGAAGAQTEKDTAAAGSQSEQTGSGPETPRARSDESSDSTQIGQGASGASQSQATVSQQDVRQAQQALKEQGQDPGPIDGIMGPLTRRALREFQEKQGLEQTGTLDAETRQRLNIDGSSSGSPGSASMEQADPGSSAPGN